MEGVFDRKGSRIKSVPSTRSRLGLTLQKGGFSSASGKKKKKTEEFSKKENRATDYLSNSSTAKDHWSIGSWLRDSTTGLQGPQTLKDWGPLLLDNFVQKPTGDFPYHWDSKQYRQKGFSNKSFKEKATTTTTRNPKTTDTENVMQHNTTNRSIVLHQ